MQPRLITKPYSFRGRIYDAYKDVFSLVNDEDWVCFVDGDTAFLEMSNFGHVLNDYINTYPTTGMFTCYASRCHYEFQMISGLDMENDSIDYWAMETVKAKAMHPQIDDLKIMIAGHLVMLKKSTWIKIQPKLVGRLKFKKILGFDTQLSHAIMECGMDIKLMKGVLLFHYLRKLTGKNNFIR